MSASMFLSPEELAVLTGRRMKSLQIAWLKREGLPFRVSATGHPVVVRSVVEGRPAEPAAPRGWSPRVVAAR